MSTVKRAVLYARVSGDDREQEGRNLAGQIEMGRQHCAKRGYSIVAELAEDERGVSGADYEAPELMRALEMANAGVFDVLVVRELDRLARNTYKLGRIEEELRKAKVSIEYVLYAFSDTPAGTMNKNVFAAMAQFERDIIRQRTMRGKKASVRQGNVMVAWYAPYGYRIGETNGRRSFIIEEEEAAIVRMIFDWYIEGIGDQRYVSARRIAEELTKIGALTAADKKNNPNFFRKKRGVGEWSYCSVRNMLINRTYMGEWSYRSEGKVFTVKVPPIIDAQRFNLADKKRASVARMSPRNTRAQYLFRRRAICACGYKMYAMTRKTILKSGEERVYQDYYCVANVRGYRTRECTEDRVYYRADIIEPRAWKLIKDVLSNPEKLEGSYADFLESGNMHRRPLQRDLDQVNGELAKATDRLTRALSLHLHGQVSQEILLEQQVEIQGRIESLTENHERLTSLLGDVPSPMETIESLREFIQGMATGLSESDGNFERQRWIVDTLDAHLTLSARGGERTAALDFMGVPVVGLLRFT